MTSVKTACGIAPTIPGGEVDGEEHGSTDDSTDPHVACHLGQAFDGIATPENLFCDDGCHDDHQLHWQRKPA